MLREGTPLATRFDQTGTRYPLYSLGYFFVEVYYEPVEAQEHRCRAFLHPVWLAAYVEGVRLPNP